ncbi:xanthine dehydrogenase family protein molybdopterin-binding subunit [Pseudonocardia alaniniphila]|uniref:Xanthine dehydrogenase family protein molybdopterin-binding subunit n=1 Tax=Pseudonocardia alaniniphila TaxID=75291 RepID=A0ABS9TNI8_9PSEU|nr:xanthine dehydrogenase family protein molybdopterin-binding subunit [Pseudonocardia alaniniphila]MCH6170088.1 xanthine dehydrogenase family protein molybdopterin-binding subunit [Pseudonocardia alaniniphila]
MTTTTTGAAVPTERVDAHAKVTGALRYGADRNPLGVLHAAFAIARVPKGRIARLDIANAEAVPGVRLVLTHESDPGVKSGGFIMGGGYGFQSRQPLTDDRIAYWGQPIALVVADTLVAANEAAALVEAVYETEDSSLDLDAPGAETLVQAEAIPLPFLADVVIGDADTVLGECAVQVDSVFDLPVQHQNPMELIHTVVEWRGDTLVVHEGTQNSGAVRNGLATQLGIDPAQVEVISPSAGGAFGQKNSLQPHTCLAAVAARRLDRPVKLVLTREQCFHAASFRPLSRHRVRLGADAAGVLRAAVYEIDQQTSRHDLFPATYTDIASRLYGIPHFRGRQRLVRTDVQTPGYMRAPHEHPAAFAIESAVDEVAYAAGIDPVALRLANDTATDPVTGHPFSSRYLAECLRRGADRFGWSRRSPEPGSMRAADGTEIGWGVAGGAYPAHTVAAVARARVEADGTVRVEAGGHEMGQGIRTAIVRTVAADLGIPTDTITVVVGDTRSVPQHLTAGSWGTASALPVVVDALAELRRELGVPAQGPVDLAAAVAALGGAPVEVETTRTAPGQPPESLDQLRRGLVALAGPEYPQFSSYSWIAHFVEVRIEATTRRVRVSRVVSVADCGRVVSPRTAESQVRGGVVWGIGATLREATEVDPRYGGFLNTSLEEYPVPVNADLLADIHVEFIDEPDSLLNGPGVKGLGEVSMVGVAPAVANAVFHATGHRIRRLPIRLEDLL